MIDKIKQNLGFTMNLVGLIAATLSVLIYLQTNFVQAADFKSFQAQEWEDKIYQLVIKENRLAIEGKKLKPEEKAYLEMLKARLANKK